MASDTGDGAAARCLRATALTMLAIASCGGETFDSAGVQIRYITKGTGEAVVLLHGFGGSIEASWSQTGILDELARQYFVVALDLRGHGQSEKPNTPSAYGSPMADDVVRLLNHLKIRRAHVIGYSMGGRIAMMLLANAPQRVRAAVIGGTGWLDRPRLQARQLVMEQTAQSLERGTGMEPMIRALMPPGQIAPADGVEAFNRNFLARNDPIALAAVARGIAELQPPESKLRATRTSVLALTGELDPNRADVERLATLARGVKVVIIPGANHLSAVRHPDFLNQVRAFLGAQRAP